MMDNWIVASGGGVLIGLAAVWLLWSLGRMAGVSGILNGILDAGKHAEKWRIGFVLGLVGVGFLFSYLTHNQPILPSDKPWWQWLLAGLLVGIGSRLANGCTSGHGVCGLGRRAKRSLFAVLIFMSVAILTVWIGRHV